jgi:hypothetical protein
MHCCHPRARAVVNGLALPTTNTQSTVQRRETQSPLVALSLSAVHLIHAHSLLMARMPGGAAQDAVFLRQVVARHYAFLTLLHMELPHGACRRVGTESPHWLPVACDIPLELTR